MKARGRQECKREWYLVPAKWPVHSLHASVIPFPAQNMKVDGEGDVSIGIWAICDAQGSKQEPPVLGSAGWKLYEEHITKVLLGKGSRKIPKLEQMLLAHIYLKLHISTPWCIRPRARNRETEISIVIPTSKHFHAEHKDSRGKV